MTPPQFLRRLAGAALALACTHAIGAQFGVAPVRLQIDASQRVKTLTISNPQATPLTVQLEAYAWTQPDGADVLSDTREVVISPPILTVPARAESKARVGLRRPTRSDSERAFRIMVTEVISRDANAGAPVQFRTRMSLPLFVPPESGSTAGPNLRWELRGQSLQIANVGKRHAQIVALSVEGPAGPVTINLPQLGYLLPGSSRAWQLPEGTAHAAQLVIKTRRGELRGPASAGP